MGTMLPPEPIRRESLQLARDTGDTVCQRAIRFHPGQWVAPRIFICLPVYRKDKPHETIADRRANFFGFLVGFSGPPT